MTTHDHPHHEDPHHPPQDTPYGYIVAGKIPPDTTDPKERSDDHPDSALTATGFHRLWMLRARYLRGRLSTSRRHKRRNT